MGDLAVDNLKPNSTMSGIIVKRNFNYHLLTPSDLPSKYCSYVLHIFSFFFFYKIDGVIFIDTLHSLRTYDSKKQYNDYLKFGT